MTLWLSDQETAFAASWSAKIDAIGEALLDWEAGEALSGARIDYHHLPGRTDELLDFRLMFGLWPARGIAALRIVGHTYGFTRSPVARVELHAVLEDERIPAFVLVFDSDDGRVLALLPDGILQRDRVAATGALGARVLARRDSSSLGLIGTGHIAEGYVSALCSVLPLDRMSVHSRDPRHAAAFAERMGEANGLDAAVAASAEDAANADVVCVATNSRTAVLEGGWLRPGTHVITTNLREPAASVAETADVAVVTCRDRTDGWRLEGAALPTQLPRIRDMLGGEWGASPGSAVSGLDDLPSVMRGRVRGRTADDEITYHANQSAGIQFAGIASAVLDGARRNGLGTQLPDELFTTRKPRRIVDHAEPTMEGLRT